MKNTYIIRHKGRTYTSHNIVLNSFRELISSGHKVTDYIAFGNGTGTPAPGNYSLFSMLGARQSEVVEYNIDSQNGDYYVLRKIVLAENEFVGQTITEIGFCPTPDLSLITHSILNEGVYKDNEPMEIAAYFYFPKSKGLLEGSNPLIKVFLGIDSLDFCAFTYGSCNYYSIQDALDITYTYPCIHTSDNLFRLICPNPLENCRDIVLFYKNRPAIVTSAAYQKIQSTVNSYTADNKGLALIEDFKKKKTVSASIDGVTSAISIQAKITSLSSRIYTRTLSLCEKIFVSKDRQYLIAVKDNMMEVYKDFDHTLEYLGKVTLKTRISFLDVCADKIAVVCNHSDTPLCAQDCRRLYFFDVSSGLRITEKIFSNDLSCDIQSISLEYAGSENMILYYISSGVLTGQMFCYQDQNPTLVQNYQADVTGAEFLGASYRRNTVFTANYQKDDLGGTLHKTLSGGGDSALYSGIILNLKSISPDIMCYNGEAIITYNKAQKKACVYSYVSQFLSFFDLNDYVAHIDKAFLDGRYIFITDADNAFYLYEIDYDLCELKLITNGVCPVSGFDRVYIMNDLIVYCCGQTLNLQPIIYDDVYIYSDQSAYNSTLNLRFSDIQYGSETGYDSFLTALTFTYS